MKIELSTRQQLGVIEQFAKTIHGLVVQMHLRRSWGIWESAAGTNPYQLQPYQREDLQEILKSIRSIKNPWERKAFIISIRWFFKNLCEEKRTHAKWQDYIVSVRKAKEEHDAEMAKRQDMIWKHVKADIVAGEITFKVESTPIDFAAEFASTPLPGKLQMERGVWNRSEVRA